MANNRLPFHFYGGAKFLMGNKCGNVGLMLAVLYFVYNVQVFL